MIWIGMESSCTKKNNLQKKNVVARAAFSRPKQSPIKWEKYMGLLRQFFDFEKTVFNSPQGNQAKSLQNFLKVFSAFSAT